MSFVSPVQHKVPSSNDYKNINITNFKGTSYSDNLFDNKSSGCSDSENIYINEENILAVRPRLQHMAELENVKEVIRVDSLDENLMIYYVVDIYGDYKLIFSDKKTSGIQSEDSIITLEEDLGKCSFFKDSNNKIICTSEKGFYEIVDREYLKLINKDHPDVYVPIVKTGMTLGNSLSGAATGETPNILTNKYYNQYQYSLNFLSEIPKDYVENRDFDLSNVIKQTKEDPESNTLQGDPAWSTNEQYGKDISRYIDFETQDIIVFYEGDQGSFIAIDSINDSYKIFRTDNPGGSIEYYPPYDTYYTWFEKTRDNAVISNEEIFTLDYMTMTNASSIGLVGCRVSRKPQEGQSAKRIGIRLDINDNDFLTKLNNLFENNEKVYCKAILKTNEDKLYISIFITVETETYNINSYEYLSVLYELDDKESHTMIADTFYFTTPAADNIDFDIKILENNKCLGLIKLNNFYKISGESDILTPYKFNIFQTDFAQQHSMIFSDYQAVPKTSEKSTALTLFEITSDKLLICLTNQKASILKNSNWEALDTEVYNISEEVGLLQLSTKTLNIIKDDRLLNCYLHKIKGTTSFITFKDVSENVNKYVIYEQWLYTNYSENSGRFKIDGFEYWTGSVISNTRWGKVLNVIRPNDNGVTNSLFLISEDNDFYIITNQVNINIAPNYDAMTITEIVHNPNYYELHSKFRFTQYKLADNKLWLFGTNNELRWSNGSSAFYFPENNYAVIGINDPITNILSLNNSSLAVFQKHATTVLSEDDYGNYVFQKTLKVPKGSLGEDQVVAIPTTNYPVVINDDSVAMLTQSSNGVVEDSVFTIISEDIFKNFSTIKKKESIKTHVHSYYIYFYWIEDDVTKIWCLDCRTLSWFKWTLPIKAKFMYESDETTNLGVETETRIITDDSEYVLTSMGITINGNDDSIFNDDISAYMDSLKNNIFRRIKWVWKSRIQTLGTVNYLKKIVSLQLIFSDRQRYSNKSTDGIFTKNNEIFYAIKTYRKKSELLSGYFKSTLDGVGIKRIKVRLPKCDFAEIMLSNFEDGIDDIRQTSTNYMMVENFDDVAQDNLIINDPESISDIYDRLHLIGITLKILLSEGLNG